MADQDNDVPESLAEQAPIIRLANSIIQQALADGATEIQIEHAEKANPQGVRGLLVKLRINGNLQDVEDAMRIPGNLHPALAERLMVMAKIDPANKGQSAIGRAKVRWRGEEWNLPTMAISRSTGMEFVLLVEKA